MERIEVKWPAVNPPSKIWGYGECLPTNSRAYAVNIPGMDEVKTHLGVVPVEPILYLRAWEGLGDDFRFAGQSWQGSGNIEVLRGSRRVVGPSYGVSPVIYRRDGSLAINSGSAGAMGWRFIAEDGTPVSADATSRLDGLNFWEYTTLGDVKIGQGENGTVVRVGSVARTLESGTCHFIRANRSGSLFAVAIVKPAEQKTVLLWFDRSEIDNLPLEVAAPAPAPLPAPSPAPSPTPGVPMPEVPSQLNLIKDVRSHYPTPLGVTHAGFLIEVAHRIGLNAGLLKKSTGTMITLPGGITVAQDIVCFPDGDIYDILGDGEGVASPSWGRANGGPLPDRYLAVNNIVDRPAPKPAPSPDPTPIPASPDSLLGPILERLDALEKQVANMQGPALIPEFDAIADCGREWGHAHKVSVKLVKK